MQIPSQPGRQVFSNGNTGGIQSRGLANKGGAGLANLGGSLAQSAGNLAYAFSYAQHQRDRINAHLDQLAQRTGAYSISLQGQTDMQADMLDLQDQIKKQIDTDQRFWTVTILNEDGEPIQVSPDDGAKLLLQRRYDKALSDADQFYGPEAKAHVAMQLEQQAFNNLSKFRSETLALRHDKQLADWQSVATRLENVAADPTNAFREHAKLDLQDHIESGLKAGLFTPTQGVKMQAQAKADIGHKYWTAFAIQRPDEMLDIAVSRGGTAVPSEGGVMTDPGKLKKLPEDLDPERLPEYVRLADAQKTRIFSDFERHQKAFAAKAEAESQQAYSDLISKATTGDASLDIEQNRGMLGPRYDDAVRFNHEWNNARRTERTRATTDASQFTQFDLLEKAKRAMFVPELLDPTNPDAITNSVVRQHVTASQDLLPEHAAPILQAISEAQKYQTQEDSGKRQAERDGFKLLERTFTVPQTLDPSSAFTLKRLEQDAYSQLAAEYMKSPQGDRNELALNLSAKFTPRVLAIQKARADELDQELLAMEKGFPSGMANAQHQLNEGTRKKLEQQNPILRGLFKLYDAKAERWQQLTEQGQRTAEAEANAKPR